MGHGANAKEAVYMLLAERLNQMPVGPVVNKNFMEILYRLYNESEAMVGSKFPGAPVKLDQIAGATGMAEDELQTTLNNMAYKGLVLPLPTPDGLVYMLNPMVVGFFEFTFMRMDKPEFVDLKEMAELFEKYFEDKEVRQGLFGSEPQTHRTLIYEKVIPYAVQTEVMTYEKASEIIREAGYWAIGLCTCRHKASHLGKTCQAKMPLESEIILGDMARLSVQVGWAREATMEEILQILDQAEKLGLVHTVDNVLNKPAYMCNCCSCCCELLNTIKKFGISAAQPSNFIPALDKESCVNCGICADKCPIDAIKMRDIGNGTEVPEINENICLGCGVCANSCGSGALTMSSRPVKYTPPNDAMDLQRRIAMSRGM